MVMIELWILIFKFLEILKLVFYYSPLEKKTLIKTNS